MYKFIAIADVHLGLKLFNLPELEQDLRDNFDRVIDLAIEMAVDYIFIAGDLLDHNKPSAELISFISSKVKKAMANNITIAGIDGDHCKAINGKSWRTVCGITPISIIDKKFVGLDYCDNSPQLVDKLASLDYKDKVEWIFLHGHVPELFKWCEEKKLLDLKQLNEIGRAHV